MYRGLTKHPRHRHCHRYHHHHQALGATWEGLDDLVAALQQNPWYPAHVDRFNRPLTVLNEQAARLTVAGQCNAALVNMDALDVLEAEARRRWRWYEAGGGERGDEGEEGEEGIESEEGITSEPEPPRLPPQQSPYDNMLEDMMVQWRGHADVLLRSCILDSFMRLGKVYLGAVQGQRDNIDPTELVTWEKEMEEWQGKWSQWWGDREEVLGRRRRRQREAEEEVGG